jgi:porin
MCEFKNLRRAALVASASAAALFLPQMAHAQGEDVVPPSVQSDALRAVPADFDRAELGVQSGAQPLPPTSNEAGSVLAVAGAPGHQGASTPEDFARLDALSETALAIVYPPVADSILADAGGWRSRLADHDISFTVRNITNFAYDVRGANRPVDTQAYNGQKFTLQTFGTFFSLGVGLEKLGIDDATILASGIYYATSWAPNGPTDTAIRQLALYKGFANRSVEVKVGYQPNYLEFIGVLTGGSPLLTSGLSSLIPVQVGLSADPSGTPTFNVTVHGKQGLYFKGGVQRSASPLGQIHEVTNNGIGLDFGARRAKALMIGEVGWKRAAAPGLGQAWVRSGLMYNTSDYTRFDDGRFEDNWSLFALADYQVAQVDQQAAYRGLFLGASAIYAPPEVNVYSQYYEARAYTVGLFSSRPSDSITLNMNYSRFSDLARRASAPPGVRLPKGQFQVSTSYSYHLSRGIYASPSIAYVRNPSFAGDFADAVNLGLNLFLQF